MYRVSELLYRGVHETENLNMKPLMTIEISIKELGKSGCPEGIRAFRQAGIVLYWTAIPDLDAYALNLYAPPDQVFWDFDIYTSLLMAEHAFCRSYGDERIKYVNSVLTRLSRQAGHKKKSGFARGVFGGWGGQLCVFSQ